MSRDWMKESAAGEVQRETSVDCAVPKLWSAHALVTSIVRCADTVPLRKHQVVLVIDHGKWS
jgi:hypothetical protein